MKIFYYCSVGTNLSLVAASLHLGVITSGDCRGIINLPYFHCLNRVEIGKPLKIGIDEFGNEIFTFGVENEEFLLSTALKDWLKILGVNQGEYLLVDLTSLEGNSLKLANFLSITLGFKSLGKYWAAKKIMKEQQKLKHRVEKVKKEVNSSLL